MAIALVAGCAGSSPGPVAAPATTSTSPAAAIPTIPTVPTVSPTPAPAPTPTPTPKPTPPAPAPTPVPADCRSYAAADPHRPVLTLDLTVDRRTVAGTERVVFTPDRPVTEVVFRLWGSAPRPAESGGTTTVTSARVDGQRVSVSRPTDTLIRLPHRGPAGTAITVDLSFRLTLPVGANDRFGNRGTTSWFGSGAPLLAWERGRGWATEPPTSGFAEASTSEDMRLAQLTVRHAAGLSVVATGAVVSASATVTVTSAPAVRDVAVAVGAFRVARVAGPVPVLVAVAPQVPDDAAAVGRELARAMRAHVRRFGPFPYARLAVAVLPDIKGGIEYPGAILLGSRQDQDATASHEVAHQWFYGLVGDDQARDPWLDEAFATYAEALDRGTAQKYLGTTIPADGRGRTGAPMTYWEGRSSYYRSVYVQGAAALLRARAASPAAFDQQVRCYVARGAWRLARPVDVRASIPLAVRELTRAGALEAGR